MSGGQGRPVIQERTIWRLASRRARRVLRLDKPDGAGEAGSEGRAIGVGLVGAGNVARWLYLPRLRRGGNRFRLRAVYDVDAESREKVAAEFGAAACSDLAAVMGAEGVDAVFVCTPVRFHAEAVLAALPAGKHVVCEKPLALSVEEARRMRDAGLASGGVQMVNFSYRWRTELSFIGQLIRAGVLGRVYHLWGSISQGQWFTENDEPAALRTDAAPWKFGPEGGVVLDLGPHVVDLCRSWLGEIRQVQAWVKRLGSGASATEAACGMSFEFDGGARAQLLTSRLATGSREQTWLEVNGSQGALRWDGRFLKLWTTEAPRWRTLLLPALKRDFLDDFYNAVAGTGAGAGAVLPTFEDGLRNNEALDAVLESARSGATISLS